MTTRLTALFVALVLMLAAYRYHQKQIRDDCRASCLFAKYNDLSHPDTWDAKIACDACRREGY
jgi:hypothetical protein